MKIEEDLNNLKNNKFITLNLEIYYLIKSNKTYSEMIGDWSFVCDSKLIQYYLRLFNRRKITLLQGHRIIYSMIPLGFSKFLFLGSSIENLHLSKTKLLEKFPFLNIECNDLGLLKKDNIGKTCSVIEDSYMLEDFHAIFVGLGAPKQDEFISKISTKCLIFGCGGSFEFLSGKVSYPPKIFEFLGLTFLWRLIGDFTLRRLIKISYTFKGAFLLLKNRDIS
jgi:exopolysaccharide biosynthesis WecB/TagA/CpsF family protein